MISVARFALAAAVLSLSACAASVPMAPDNVDAWAKSFSPPPPDRAHVYVFRNEGAGFGVKFHLRLDGQAAGTTVAKSFVLLPVRPGAHMLESEAENKSDLPIFAQPGQILFIWQEVKMGVWSARNKLQIVSPEFGAPGVRECKLIAFPPPPLPPMMAPPPPAPLPAPNPQQPAPPVTTPAAPIPVS